MPINTVLKKVSSTPAETTSKSWQKLRQNTSQLIKLVTRRSDLGANDSVNWGVIGKEFTCLPGKFEINSAQGVKLTVSCPGNFLRIDEGNGINGNFALGDKLLFLEFSDDVITIDLATPVKGVGTQIQKAFFGVFTGVLEAFDNQGKSLGNFSISGNSNGAVNNTAAFVGILSQTANISRITLYVPENRGYGFTINQLDLVTDFAPERSLVDNLLLFADDSTTNTVLNIYHSSNQP